MNAAYFKGSNCTFMELKSTIWMHVQWDMEF